MVISSFDKVSASQTLPSYLAGGALRTCVEEEEEGVVKPGHKSGRRLTFWAFPEEEKIDLGSTPPL